MLRVHLFIIDAMNLCLAVSAKRQLGADKYQFVDFVLMTAPGDLALVSIDKDLVDS